MIKNEQIRIFVVSNGFVVQPYMPSDYGRNQGALEENLVFETKQKLLQYLGAHFDDSKPYKVD